MPIVNSAGLGMDTDRSAAPLLNLTNHHRGGTLFWVLEEFAVLVIAIAPSRSSDDSLSEDSSSFHGFHLVLIILN